MKSGGDLNRYAVCLKMIANSDSTETKSQSVKSGSLVFLAYWEGFSNSLYTIQAYEGLYNGREPVMHLQTELSAIDVAEVVIAYFKKYPEDLDIPANIALVGALEDAKLIKKIKQDGRP